MKKNILGPVIKEARKNKKLTQKQLSELTGYSQNTISNHENGNRSLSEKDIKIYSAALNLTPDDLFDSLLVNNREATKKGETIDKQIIEKIKLLTNENKEKILKLIDDIYKIQYKEIYVNEVVDIQKYKQYKDVELTSKVSAGNGIVDLDPSYTETIQYDGELPDNYDLAFEVCGDSMEPMFKNKDIVFVKYSPDAINGALMVVQINEEAFVKKVYIEDRNIRLVSLNKEYQDQIYSYDNSEIKIIGKVVF